MPARTTVMFRFRARSMMAARLRCRSRRQAPQRVVAPERDNQHAHVAVERPVHAAKPSRRGVAGHAGVDHLHVQAARPQPRREQARVRLGGGEAVPRRQAVAEEDDLRPRCGLGRGRNGCPGLGRRRRGLAPARGSERQPEQNGGGPPTDRSSSHESPSRFSILGGSAGSDDGRALPHPAAGRRERGKGPPALHKWPVP